MEKTSLLSSSSSSSSDQSSDDSSSSFPESTPPSYTLVDIEYDRSKKFDVFVNFRGEDTRKNILGHLRAALSAKGIKAFVDDAQIQRGRYISSQLLEAVEDSRCSVVILSPNYASSSWCLDELVKILDCMRTRAQIVIPVFYHVEPSHVRKQNGTFGEAFTQHESSSLLSEEEAEERSERVRRWRVALQEVTSLAGLDLRNYRDEAHFIEEIVAEVSLKLDTLVSSKCIEVEQSPQEKALLSFGRGVASCLGAIGFLLVFFLVVFPLFGLFFFKVVFPIIEQVLGVNKDHW